MQPQRSQMSAHHAHTHTQPQPQRTPSLASSPSTSSPGITSQKRRRDQETSPPPATTASLQGQASSHVAVDTTIDRPRRIGRACLQCRARKQKCLVNEANEEDPHAPCRRCLRNRFECSFEAAEDRGSAPMPPSLANGEAQALVRQVQRLEERVKLLEERGAGMAASSKRIDSHHHSRPSLSLLGSMDQEHERSDLPTLADVVTAHGRYQPEIVSTGKSSSHQQTQVHEAHHQQRHQSQTQHSEPYTPATVHSTAGVESLRLDAPTATLRSLVGAIAREVPSASSSPSASSQWDPVSRGLLTLDDATQCIHTYSWSCHSMAPFLDETMLRSLPRLRSRPNLFLAICCVGARFWKRGNSPFSHHLTTHPNYDAMIKLLDESLAAFLLRPNSKDLTLESIQALLVTAQWMPMVPSAGSPKRYESRYSEMSAWSMLGLAGRHAFFLGLEKGSSPPFEGWRGDRQTYKTWHNLLTCDANLMMTSGLPPSTYAASAAKNILSLEAHGLSQTGDDVRVAALLQLAAIAQRAVPRAGLLQNIKEEAIVRCNTELDDWQREWTEHLRHWGTRRDQMPFTSLRWYRLTINSSALRPLLSAQVGPRRRQSLTSFHVDALAYSLDAAAYLLISFTRFAQAHDVAALSTQTGQCFPNSEETWCYDEHAVQRLCFALDSTWVTLTFATVFLILCRIRLYIDDDLQIMISNHTAVDLSRAQLARPRSRNLFQKLTTLARKVFDTVCELAPGPHPAHDLRVVVHSVINSVAAASPLLDSREAPPVPETPSRGTHDQVASGVEPAAVQPLQDLLDGSGLQWLGEVWDNMMTENDGIAEGGYLTSSWSSL